MKTLPKHTTALNRRGAVLPFIAIMLPVLIMLCGFAINLAYMQLTHTELKIATDAAARAGGRAWSETQDISQAKLFARLAAEGNLVAGEGLLLRDVDADNEIQFGMSIKSGAGRFAFSQVPTAQVIAGTAEANSIRVVGKRTTGSIGGPIGLLIGGVGATTEFAPELQSTCIQLDRDVALVLDRSGSMAYSANDKLIFDMLVDLRDDVEIVDTEVKSAMWGIEDIDAQAMFPDILDFNIYSRNFSDNVLSKITDANLLGHADAVGQAYTSEQITDAKAYGEGVNSYNDTNLAMAQRPAPPFSRWEILGEAVDAFFDVISGSPQQEQAALATFNDVGHGDQSLIDNANGYAEVSNLINGWSETDAITGDEIYHPGIRPSGGTAIGGGLQEAIALLFGVDGNPPPPESRPYAEKTVVFMTDGRQNTSPSPEDVATTIMSQYNVQIHTVTFTPQADQAVMQAVASIGNGKHYHANTPGELIAIFQEIANNLPTTMVE